MTVRRIGDSGDITTSGVQFTTERAEIAQTIATRLKLFLGEYFRDVTEGCDWFGRVLGKPDNLFLADAEIKRVISQTDGVIGIISYQNDYELSSRRYDITGEVLTEYGIVEFTTFEAPIPVPQPPVTSSSLAYAAIVINV